MDRRDRGWLAIAREHDSDTRPRAKRADPNLVFTSQLRPVFLTGRAIDSGQKSFYTHAMSRGHHSFGFVALLVGLLLLVHHVANAGKSAGVALAGVVEGGGEFNPGRSAG